MTGGKICANPACGREFRRERSKTTGKIETPSEFARRRYCSTSCANTGNRKWGEAALAELRALRADGLSFAECATRLSGRHGLGQVSRNAVAGAYRGQRAEPAPAAAARDCEACGEPLVRKRWPGTDKIETADNFARRRFCGKSCAQRDRHRKNARWTPEAEHELRLQLARGKPRGEIARALRAKGHGTFTKSAICGKTWRLGLAGEDGPEEAEKPPAPPQPIAVRPPEVRDKPPGRCRHGDCRNPRQPGRDYCAAHHLELVVALKPRSAGWEGVGVGGMP